MIVSMGLMEPELLSEALGLANTKGQPLVEHCFAVGYVAHCLLKALVDDPPLQRATFLAGVLHDVGKLDPAFQEWVAPKSKKNPAEYVPEDGQHIDKGAFNFQNHARHNEISLLLYGLLDNTENRKINRQLKSLIRHVIYWHHAKPIRKDEFATLESIAKALAKPGAPSPLPALILQVHPFIAAVNRTGIEYGTDEGFFIDSLKLELDSDALYDLPTTAVPEFKLYHDSSNQLPDFVRSIDENAKRNLARAAVVSADRLVSALTREQLILHINHQTLSELLNHCLGDSDPLLPHLENCLFGFERRFPGSERNQAQSTAANGLKNISGVAVLNGPAGCGKTKIALEWAQKISAKKIIWVCPRVQICQGLLLDLTCAEYLPEARIEIHTGEFQYIVHQGRKTPTAENQVFSGDIVLTTIDQILNVITTHRNVTGLIEYLQACVVFDEFHEYIPMPGFNLLFAELVRCKQFCHPRANTLLVSATPNYRFVETVLGIDREDVIGIPSFNCGRYQIDFKTYEEQARGPENPLYAPQPPNSIVISNTATTAQLSFIANRPGEKAVLLHSKFKPSDKQTLFDAVFRSFGPGGDHRFDVLRSGPIVQAALNITCSHMVTEFTHAENWLQRLGRLNRFSEQSCTVHYQTAIPSTLVTGGRAGACERFLAAMDTLESAKAWYRFLQQQNLTEPHTVNQIYDWYESFYRSREGQQAVDQDLVRSLQKGVAVLKSQLLDPVCLPRLPETDGKKRLKRVSLRGDSRYVQMAQLQVHSIERWEVLDIYACDMGGGNDLLTLPIEEIEGYDAMSDNNLLRYMHQKHHKIMTAKTGVKQKKAYKLFLLEQEAIDPDHPIYLSYTARDLGLCHDTPHPRAIYYAVSEHQAIGALSIHKLTSID